MVDPIEALIASRVAPAGPARQASAPSAAPATSFREVLAQRTAASAPVTFSRHARERLAQRAIPFDALRQERLQEAVDRAERRGARDSLVLLDDLALVVNIRSRTVLTAVDGASRKEGVFTNIDSVVLT